MKLKYVVASVNNNPKYYNFIPYQIRAWNYVGIKFICFFISKEPLPTELEPYKENIVLLNTYPEKINDVFLAQNARVFCCAFLENDGFAMITDMDMLPMNFNYFLEEIKDNFTDEFIYYRHIDEFQKQIYMCYNAALPSTWSKLFNVRTVDDMWKRLEEIYPSTYEPRKEGWYTDQVLMYSVLKPYEKLKVLEKPISHRLEPWTIHDAIRSYTRNQLLGTGFIDAHFHTDFFRYKDDLVIFCDKMYPPL